MKLLKLPMHFLFGIIGIIFISCTPVLFQNGFEFSITKYLQSVWSTIKSFVTPSEWYFIQFIGGREVEKPILSYLFDNYLYTMTVLLSAIAIAIIVGFMLAVIAFQLPSIFKKTILRVLYLLEAFPDVLFIFLLQLFIVWFYKSYDVLLFGFATLGDEKVYVSPILSLAIVPTVLFLKITFLLLEEEWTKDYVQLAKSKGFSKFSILMRHCVRNIKHQLFIQSKPIIWITLSALLIIEYLHNFQGIIRLVTTDSRPFIFAVGLTLIFTPFYIIFNCLELLLNINDKRFHDDNAKLYRQITLFSRIKVNNSVINNRKVKAKQFSETFLSLCRKPKFVLSIIFLLGLTVFSFLYDVLKQQPIAKVEMFRDDSGELHGPPHPPGFFLLGSDAYGYSVLDMLIVGAKYTILFAALIAFLRILLGYVCTIPYMFWLGRGAKQMINKVADGMQFLPLTLIAYILLARVVIFGSNARPLAESQIVPNLILTVLILTVVVIPVILNNLGSEANELLKSDHIQSAIVLGASRSGIFFKHITLHLFPKMIYLFGQQMAQVLQTFIHLGVFGIFLGGGLAGTTYPFKPPQSLLNDWTYFFTYLREVISSNQYWLIVPVLILYIGLILSIQGLTKSMIEDQQSKIGVYQKLPIRRKKKRQNHYSTSPIDPQQELFVYTRNIHQ
ncbi:ABC transporter permease subunit [Aquibacillus koreensis]|uniref:ABC transporter permease subunit n=1 Tax=Aquibacillus koreensis TaxID=279446 RepID=A0A9X3WKH4_9BACI|nr:ABC transporter permease subunit [Aquibacillus koreensis]MCT2536279.1 ABC transporter permease subunit [Aquibacillus koreensis]MDC3421370.1 ABC transporter permease subunit [Aquibacillus koreensis]